MPAAPRTWWSFTTSIGSPTYSSRIRPTVPSVLSSMRWIRLSAGGWVTVGRVTSIAAARRVRELDASSSIFAPSLARRRQHRAHDAPLALPGGSI